MQKASLLLLIALMTTAPEVSACREFYRSHEQRLAAAELAVVARVSGISMASLERPEMRDDDNSVLAAVMATRTIRMAIIQRLKGDVPSIITIDVSQCNGRLVSLGSKVRAYRIGTYWHLEEIPLPPAEESIGGKKRPNYSFKGNQNRTDSGPLNSGVRPMKNIALLLLSLCAGCSITGQLRKGAEAPRFDGDNVQCWVSPGVIAKPYDNAACGPQATEDAAKAACVVDASTRLTRRPSLASAIEEIDHCMRTKGWTLSPMLIIVDAMETSRIPTCEDSYPAENCPGRNK